MQVLLSGDPHLGPCNAFPKHFKWIWEMSNTVFPETYGCHKSLTTCTLPLFCCTTQYCHKLHVARPLWIVPSPGRCNLLKYSFCKRDEVWLKFLYALLCYRLDLIWGKISKEGTYGPSPFQFRSTECYWFAPWNMQRSEHQPKVVFAMGGQSLQSQRVGCSTCGSSEWWAWAFRSHNQHKTEKVCGHSFTDHGPEWIGAKMAGITHETLYQSSISSFVDFSLHY